jgi:2-deoxy-D-gluconate 3-dehydrogenase
MMKMNRKMQEFSIDYFSLKGKVAIITGGNTNLGLGYSTALAKVGADLFIPHFVDDVDEVREIVEKEGRRIEFLKGDLTDEAYRKEVIAKCLEKYGKIDILINNAGINAFGDFQTFPNSLFAKIIELNLNVTYYFGREVALEMIKQGHGKIINIGSALSFTADERSMPYVISKHGVVGVTRDFANELGNYNIQCNAICPGFFATEINADIDPVIYERIAKRLPQGKWGDPADLMGPAVFLASKASDYINGWLINVDGGFTCII